MGGSLECRSHTFLHSNSGLNAEQGRPGLLAQSHSILPKAMITNHNTTVSVPGHEKSHHNLPRTFMVESPKVIEASFPALDRLLNLIDPWLTRGKEARRSDQGMRRQKERREAPESPEEQYSGERSSRPTSTGEGISRAKGELAPEFLLKRGV